MTALTVDPRHNYLEVEEVEPALGSLEVDIESDALENVGTGSLETAPEGKNSHYFPSGIKVAKNDPITKDDNHHTTIGVNTVGKSIPSCLSGANHTSVTVGTLAPVD